MPRGPRKPSTAPASPSGHSSRSCIWPYRRLLRCGRERRTDRHGAIVTKEEAMFSTNTLRRLPVALALAGAVCAFTVPQALAGGTSKDSPPEPPYTRLSPVERIILQEKAHKRDPVYSRGLVPAAPSVPDVVERYVAAHPYGRGL